MMDWLWRIWSLVEAALPVAVVIAAFLGLARLVARSAVKSYVEGRIQYGFAKDLESVKADLRRTEEEFRSTLRMREVEITSLHGALLSGRTQRLSLLDKRRVEAVEAVWTAVHRLAPLKNTSALMSAVKLSRIAEEGPHDPKMREFMAALLPKDDLIRQGMLDKPVKDQPFVSPLAWAYYAAYAAICAYYYTYAKLVSIGAENAGETTDGEYLKKVVKVALPHAVEKIDTWDVSTFHYLLDPLEELLLAELRRNLDDPSIDEQRVKQAKAIIAAIAEREVVLAAMPTGLKPQPPSET